MGFAKTVAIGDNFCFGSPMKWPNSFGTSATDVLLGIITLPAISGRIKYVFLDIYVGRMRNSNANQNYTDGAQVIIAENGGGDVTAINLPAQSFYLPAQTDEHGWPGVHITGCIDCKTAFTLGGATNIYWRQSKWVQNTAQFQDVCCAARVIME